MVMAGPGLCLTKYDHLTIDGRLWLGITKSRQMSCAKAQCDNIPPRRRGLYNTHRVGWPSKSSGSSRPQDSCGPTCGLGVFAANAVRWWAPQIRAACRSAPDFSGESVLLLAGLVAFERMVVCGVVVASFVQVWFAGRHMAEGAGLPFSHTRAWSRTGLRWPTANRQSGSLLEARSSGFSALLAVSSINTRAIALPWRLIVDFQDRHACPMLFDNVAVVTISGQVTTLRYKF